MIYFCPCFKEKKIMNKFFKYIFNPKYDVIHNNSSVFQTIIYCLKIFVVLFFIKIALKEGIEAIFSLPKNDAAPAFIDSHSFLYVFFIGALLIPILEELSCRGLLVFNKWIFIPVIVLSYYILNLILGVKNFNFDNFLLIRIAIPIGIGLIMLWATQKYYDLLSDFWKKRFSYIFYIIALAFGFLHFQNYTLEGKDLLLIPLITITQIIDGFFFGYVRMNFGLAYSILFHMLNNSIGIIIVFIAKNAFS